MYRLVKSEGMGPVVDTEVDRSQDWRRLEEDRDRLTAESFADGPGSLAALRYGVRPI